MKKLYEKNEIWFAVLWIMIYVMVMGNLRDSFGDDSLYSLLGVGAIALLITLFIGKNGLWKKYGFRKIGDPKTYLFYLPFLLMATVNFWPGISAHSSGIAQLYAVLTMAVVGYVEEVLFRGFLFKAIEKDNVKQAVIISAVTFGAGHIINLFTGQATLDTVLQMLYAIAIGFSFVMVFYKSRSLIPCIVTHSLIDMTSKFSGKSTVTLDIVISAIILVVAGGYAYYLHRCVKPEADS